MTPIEPPKCPHCNTLTEPSPEHDYSWLPKGNAFICPSCNAVFHIAIIPKTFREVEQAIDQAIPKVIKDFPDITIKKTTRQPVPPGKDHEKGKGAKASDE